MTETNQAELGGFVCSVGGFWFVFFNVQPPLPAALGTLLRVVAGLALALVLALWVLTNRRRTGSSPEGAPETVAPGAWAERTAHAGASAARPRERAVADGPGPPAGYRTRYWVVVAAEVVAIFGGIWVIRAAGAPTEAIIAWVAFVVGAHFVPLAYVFGFAPMVPLGAVVAALGATGLVLSATAAVAWTPLVSGVLTGVVLLGFGLLNGRRLHAASSEDLSQGPQ